MCFIAIPIAAKSIQNRQDDKSLEGIVKHLLQY